MTWGVREGELSCSAGEGEFFRFNLLCSFRFHRDFISFHKAVHSLTIKRYTHSQPQSSSFSIHIPVTRFSLTRKCSSANQHRGIYVVWVLLLLHDIQHTTVNILLSPLTPVDRPIPATTWTLGVPTATWATDRSTAFWFVSVLSNCSDSSHCARQVRRMYWLHRQPAACPVHLHYPNDKTVIWCFSDRAS
jgi:hypothetical protein